MNDKCSVCANDEIIKRYQAVVDQSKKQIDDLSKKRDEYAKKIDEVQSSAGDAWKQLRAGMDKAFVSRLETGQGNPTVDTLARYAAALGKRVVFGIEDEPAATRA